MGNQHDEIICILLDILRDALLRIRSLGMQGHAKECSIEADHVHNLPTLIKNLDRNQLLFYFNVEKEIFLRDSTTNVNQYQLLWSKLADLIQKEETNE